MIQPYYEEPGITIYHADCRDVLPTLADSSIDCIFSDPEMAVKRLAQGVLSFEH